MWSDFSELIFRAKSRGQKLDVGLLLTQVDLIFTVSHPVFCLSSRRLNVRNGQVSNIDGQTLVDSETWNQPKIFKSRKSVKPAGKTGCFVKCPQPPIFTWDLREKKERKREKPAQEQTALLIFSLLNSLKSQHMALEPSSEQVNALRQETVNFFKCIWRLKIYVRVFFIHFVFLNVFLPVFFYIHAVQERI